MNNFVKHESRLDWFKFGIILLFCILLWGLGLWGTHYFVNAHVVSSQEPNNDLLSNPGMFGDSAGAINALISAFAFASMVFAILLQRKELKLQREELKLTREEMQGQKEEFHQQNETMKQQRFENTLFNMLSLQHDIVNSLLFAYNRRVRTKIHGHESPMPTEEVSTTMEEIHGRALFQFFFENQLSLRSEINTKGIAGYDDYIHMPYFDHYFRHLYRIVKFVDETDLINTYEDKYQYTSMLRAQLSRYELIWLYYNCLSRNGIIKFKPLVEKYALLKNLRIDLLAQRADLNISRYNSLAYGNLPKETFDLSHGLSDESPKVE